MKQILVIDDEPQIRTMLKKMIEQQGFNVLVASNGKEGMDLFNKEDVDLIVTDLIMPEKEGIELIIELKKTDPELPIIAISGGGKNAPEQYLSTAKALGAYAIFEKPVSKNDLIDAINKVLHNKL